MTPALLRLAVEVDDAVHLPVVGDRDGRHAELGRLPDELVDEDHPVEQAVLGVHVQVHEVGVFQGRASILFVVARMIGAGPGRVNQPAGPVNPPCPPLAKGG